MEEAPDDNGYWKIDPTQQYLCSPDNSGLLSCKEGTFCGHPKDFNMEFSRGQPEIDSVIQYRLLSFDNIGLAMLTIF